MIAKPLVGVKATVDMLENSGCAFRVEDDALIIHDPDKVLERKPELREAIKNNKMAVLAYVQHKALVQLLRVLEMAQPDVCRGMQEDYLFALTAAGRLTGNIWEE